MKKSILSILGFVTVMFLISCGGIETKNFDSVKDMVEDAKSNVEFISQADFKAVLESEDEFYLIDCREKNEFDTSCIKSAINIPRGLVEFKIGNEAPKRRQDLYIYCSNGERSALAASVLPYLKYTNVYVIESGFDVWQEKYPDLVEHHPQRGASQTKAAAAPSGGCGG